VGFNDEYMKYTGYLTPPTVAETNNEGRLADTSALLKATKLVQLKYEFASKSGGPKCWYLPKGILIDCGVICMK
jgi:hypothetical protein